MFNIGGGELLVILLIALIVLGPQKLPEAARTVGRVVRELQRLSSGFQREFQKAIEDEELNDLGRGRTTTRPEPVPLASVIGELDTDHDTDDPSQSAHPDETDEASATDRTADNETEPDRSRGEAPPATITPTSADGNGANASRSGPNGADRNRQRGDETGDDAVADEVGRALDEIVADDADGGQTR